MRSDRHFVKIMLGTVGGLLLIPLQYGAIAQTEPLPENPWSELSTGFAEETIPESGIGGVSRGKVHFQLPGSASNPRSSIGGGSRGAVGFSLPDADSSPRSSIGGGSRGAVGFSLPDTASSPRSSIGGGSRDAVQFRLPSGDGSPRSSIGGGSRGGVQFSLPDSQGNPRSSIGGGSRDAVSFRLPESDASPRSSIGAGSRGTTRVSILKALLPPNNSGQTLAAHPVIFVYLPPLGAEEVFFSLQDEDGTFYFDTVLPSPADGGIVAVQVPEAIAPLAVDKHYLWYFAPIEPGGRLLPNNYSVTGWIKRVGDKQEPTATDPVQRAVAYAQQGLWYDTLTSLAIAHMNEPENEEYATEWRDLLAQVDLEALSTEPITGVLNAP